MAGLPKSIIAKYGVSKKAWAVFRGRKTTRRKRGVSMVKRRRGRSGGSRSSGALIATGGLLGGALLGVGAAALAKRFIGAPLGTFTGAAAGFTVGGLGGAVGGWVHDNIGNSGSVF